MATKDKKKGKLKQKLTDKYRLVVLNENTFEEKFSLKLSRLNVFVFGSIFSIALILITFTFVVFTPIKEYIPGYPSTQLKRNTAALIFKTDSLKTKLAFLEKYTKVLKPVLTGSFKVETIDSFRNEAARLVIIDKQKLNATKRDSLFREKIDNNDRFPLIENAKNTVKIVFFAPVSGRLTQAFNANNKHFAVDITAKTGTPIKAAAEGTVILAEWTAETGYIITIQHANRYISVYKHNGSLLKSQGDFVKSGEVIANVGSTGELTTGPHLHFELWSDGYPVNPLNYIDFR